MESVNFPEQKPVLLQLNEVALVCREWIEKETFGAGVDQVFTTLLRIKVKDDEQMYEFLGEGRSKKGCKIDAAGKALSWLRQNDKIPAMKIKRKRPFPDTNAAHPVHVPNSFAELGADENLGPQLKSSPYIEACKVLNETLAKKRSKEKIELKCEWGDYTENPDNKHSEVWRFKVTLTLSDSRTFEGYGPSKKAARNAAAARALASPDLQMFCRDQSIENFFCCNAKSSQRQDNNDWANHFSSLVMLQLSTMLMEQTVLNKYNVCSGLALTEGSDYIKSASLIAVTTGTKCLSATYCRSNGKPLHDCHAEILIKRCLFRYLVSQLNALRNPETADASLFEKTPNDEGLLRIKPQYKFHVYISSAPCGDARLFAINQAAGKLSKRGLIRTKMETGEGTIPVKDGNYATETIETQKQPWVVDNFQSIETLIEGNSLRIPSCSDKLFIKNRLGWQGGLLSSLIEPVHMETIVISKIFQHSHCRRALVTRDLAPSVFAQLPVPYNNIPEPSLLGTHCHVEPGVKRAPGHAHAWQLCQKETEVIATNSGLVIVGPQPRARMQSTLSKLTQSRCLVDVILPIMSLLSPRRFTELAGSLLVQPDGSHLTTITEEIFSKLTYRDAKERFSPAYCAAKKLLEKALFDADLGQWLHFPKSEFTLGVSDPSNDSVVVDKVKPTLTKQN